MKVTGWVRGGRVEAAHAVRAGADPWARGPGTASSNTKSGMPSTTCTETALGVRLSGAYGRHRSPIGPYSICLRACYALPGNDVAYGATRCVILPGVAGWRLRRRGAGARTMTCTLTFLVLAPTALRLC
eukprot:660949-Rhodomonas_salina.1